MLCFLYLFHHSYILSLALMRGQSVTPIVLPVYFANDNERHSSDYMHTGFGI